MQSIIPFCAETLRGETVIVGGSAQGLHGATGYGEGRPTVREVVA